MAFPEKNLPGLKHKASGYDQINCAVLKRSPAIKYETDLIKWLELL